MRLLIFLAVWKRPEITEICFMGIKRLQKVPGFQVEALAVISEESMIPLCDKYGVDWVMTANSPLGAKKNFGAKEALKHDFDYMIEIGSDDLLKSEALQVYKWDAPVIGLMDFAIINTSNGGCKKVSSSISKFGAGRAIKRSVLESTKLWVDRKEYGLDNCSTMMLAKKGIMAHGIRCENPLAVALKSDVNLWSYRSIPGRKYSLVDALNGLSEEEINAIKRCYRPELISVGSTVG
jgi:hypothetical protein